MIKIAENQITRLQDKLRTEHTIDLSLTDEAITWLAQRVHDPSRGARPLSRLIDKKVLDRISAMLLSKQLRRNYRLQIDVQQGKLDFTVEQCEGD
ncbi:MAG: hypothetical protein ABFQ89_03520 [Chloroflexota bacterium]